MFILLFWFFHHENKKEKEKDSLLKLLLAATFFSVILTVVFVFFLFLIIGSTTVIDTLFSLHINTNQLIAIGISFLIYWFTIDNILEMLFEYLLGENAYAILSLAPTRMATFYIIGIILNLNNTVNMTISIGISLILLTIDMLFFFRKERSYL